MAVEWMIRVWNNECRQDLDLRRAVRGHERSFLFARVVSLPTSLLPLKGPMIGPLELPEKIVQLLNLYLIRGAPKPSQNRLNLQATHRRQRRGQRTIGTRGKHKIVDPVQVPFH